MSLQQGCSDICQIWPWYSIGDQCFDVLQNAKIRRTEEIGLVTPTPAVYSSHYWSLYWKKKKKIIGPVFSFGLSKVLANQRRRYICNILSHWPRPCSAIEGKHPLLSPPILDVYSYPYLSLSPLLQLSLLSPRKSSSVVMSVFQSFHSLFSCFLQPKRTSTALTTPTFASKRSCCNDPTSPQRSPLMPTSHHQGEAHQKRYGNNEFILRLLNHFKDVYICMSFHYTSIFNVDKLLNLPCVQSSMYSIFFSWLTSQTIHFVDLLM